MLKLTTIIGTRPEIIRLSEVIKCCDRYFDHTLVHTGQNYDYELNEIFFHDLKLRSPDVFLQAVGENLGHTMGNIISKSYDYFMQNKPDALLILGDTNSALCAISAKRLKIPIFHMEAGNRCFDINVPEEINRKIVDHISDVNMAYTEHSRRYLLAEGLSPDRVFVTGSPMAEVLDAHKTSIEISTILNKLGLEQGNYFVISAHREENVDNINNLSSLVHAFNEIAIKYSKPMIYSLHPRSRTKIEKSGLKLHELIKPIPPLGLFDYIKLQKNSAVVLSDSGTLSEESSILGFNSVLIRTSTERPEVLDKGSVIIGGITPKEILQAVELSQAMNNEPYSDVTDYTEKNVSVKVVKIIQSFSTVRGQR